MSRLETIFAYIIYGPFLLLDWIDEILEDQYRTREDINSPMAYPKKTILKIGGVCFIVGLLIGLIF